jgi:hypothetical protein
MIKLCPGNVRFLRYRSKPAGPTGSALEQQRGPVPMPCVREMREVPGSTAHQEIRCSVLSSSRARTHRRAVLGYALAFAESIRFCPTARRAGIPLVHLHQQYEKLMRHFLGDFVVLSEPLADHRLHDPIEAGGLAGSIYDGTAIRHVRYPTLAHVRQIGEPQLVPQSRREPAKYRRHSAGRIPLFLLFLDRPVLGLSETLVEYSSV